MLDDPNTADRAANEQYRQRGYRLFRAALPADEVGSLADLAFRLLTPYRGEIRRQNGQMEFNEYCPFSTHYTNPLIVNNPILNGHLSLPEGLEPLTAALRSLVTSPALADRLHALDGAEHYTIHQTILFIAAPTTEIHIDSWSLDTAPRGFAHTAWIPLKDLELLSGLPCVIPWPQGKVMTEAALDLPEAELPFHLRYERYQKELAKRMLATSTDVVTSFMRKGDMMVWSSLTPHCTLPSRPHPIKRPALQVLLRPTHMRWGNFVNQPPESTPDRAERITDRFSFLLD